MSLFTKPGRKAKEDPAEQWKPGPEVQVGQELESNEGTGQGAPAEVLRKCRIVERTVRHHEPRWREIEAMFDGDQFAYVSAADGQLTTLETREGGQKPAHRPRLSRNRMTRAIVNEVSVLTSRFPNYQATPLNADPETTDAANIGSKVLISEHRKLKLRRKVFQVALASALTGDGYAWPYWDGSVGTPIIMEPTGLERMEGAADQVNTGLKTGEIAVRVLRQEQIGWEPGIEFERSRWYCVILTESIEQLVKMPGYVGPEALHSDCRPFSLSPKDSNMDRKLIYVYHFLERPSVEHPQGRWLQVANGKLIRKPDAYPCSDDRPVIHRLPWIERGDRRDRSLGLGELVLDIQRSINRICNQLIAWRNLVLVPQMIAPEDTVVNPILTEEPGLIVRYRGNQPPSWREVPEIPVSLYKELEQAYADMDFTVGQGAALIPGIESGSAIQAVNEREQSYRSMLLSNLADFYGSLGEHILYLVAKHWTEERIVEVTGRFGVENIPNFVGEMLDGKISSVLVSEASIEPRTREAQEAKIMAFADKGWISPERAMQALNGGMSESIIDDYELDIARVHRQIQGLITLGRDPNLVEIGGLEASEEASAEAAAMLIPMAMPQVDNHPVFVDVITSWMKTVDFEKQPPLVQEATMNWLNMHQQAIIDEQMREAQMLMAQADSQGMQNAGKDQGGKPTEPSRPSINNEAAALQGNPQTD